MGHKHTKDEILTGAVETAFESGLSQLTFGRIAKHLGINDRTVVYYFPTKDDLLSDVLVAMGSQLQTTLAPAFASTRAADHLELLRAAWPVLAVDESEAVFALFFEANGLAVTGREPYATLVRALVDTWITWAAEFIEGDDVHRRAEAETAIAVLDGLLLLRMLTGADAAERAAARLGITVPA